jgi:hypothetical protein
MVRLCSPPTVTRNLPDFHEAVALGVELGHRLFHVEGLGVERRRGGDADLARLAAELVVVELHRLRGAQEQRRGAVAEVPLP